MKERYLAKLTSEHIKEIKKLLQDERGIKQEWIAKKYGVSQPTISRWGVKLNLRRNKTKQAV